MANSDKMSRSIMERTRKAVGVAPRYASGTAKLFLASGAEFFKNEMPAPIAMVETNQELLQDAVRFLRNPVDAINKQVNRALGSDDFKALQKFARNALDDLKTGNLYDPVRDRSELGMQIDADLANFGGMDLGNFDENGDWIEDSGDDFNEDIQISIAKIQDKNDSRRTEATIDAIGMSTKAITATENANAQMNLRMSLKQHSQQMQAMENMITAQTSTFELINKSVQAQVNVTREAHTQMMGKLDEITGLLTKIADGVTPKNDRKEYKDQPDIFGANGELDIKQYAKQVFRNIDDKFAIKSMASNLTIGMGIKGLVELVQDNPWMLVSSAIINRIVPEDLKTQMRRTNKNIESFMPALLQKMGERGRLYEEGKSDKISDAIWGLLGVKPRSRSAIETAYENPIKQAQFTSKTARAIEEVIPMWLSRIDSHLTGGPLMVYNYKTGRLERAGNVVANYERSTKDLVGRMGESASEVMDRAGMYNFRTSDEKKEFQDYVHRFLQRSAEENRFINPYDATFKDLLPEGSKKDLYSNLLMGIMRSMPRDKVMQLSRDMLSARTSRDRNTYNTNAELQDSGLIAAWSGFMDPKLQSRLSSDATKGYAALTDAEIDTISKHVHDEVVRQGGPRATNVLLTDILRTLRKGIITYSYNIGHRVNTSKLPEYLKTRVEEAQKAVGDTLTDEQRIRDRENRERQYRESRRTREEAISDTRMKDATRGIKDLFVVDGMQYEDAEHFQAAVNYLADSKDDPNNPVVRRYQETLKSKWSELDGTRRDVMKKTGVTTVLDSLQVLATKPFELFDNGLQLADAFMFKMLFGEDAASSVQLNNQEPYLFQTLTNSLNVHFMNAKNWFADNIGAPVKKFLLDDKEGLLPRIGHTINETFGLTDKKNRIKSKFGEYRESLMGVKGEDGTYSGGRFSDSLNRYHGYGKTAEERVAGAFNHFLYGDYADEKRKGVKTVHNRDEKGRFTKGMHNEYGGAIGMLRQGFDKTQDFLFGDEDSKSKWGFVKKEFNNALPDTIVGSGVGLLAGLFMPGGPILGAVLGGTAGLVKGSSALSSFLFGEFSETDTVEATDFAGNVIRNRKTGEVKQWKKQTKEGIISQKVYEGMKQYIPGLSIGSVAGAVAGGLGILPFGMGSMAGAVIGGMGGILTSSNKFKELLFGDMEDPDSGLISKNFRDKVKDNIKKYAPSTITGGMIGSVIGSGLGLIPGLSLLPTSPIMGFLGASVGMSQTEKFNKFLFGEEVTVSEEVDGKTVTRKERQGGMFGSMFDFAKNKLITPLAKRFDDIGNNIGKWFHKDVLGPLERAFEPLKNNILEAGRKIKDSMINIGDHIVTGILSAFNINIGGSLKDFVKDKVIPKFQETTNKFFSAIGKMIGGILSAPFKALEFIVTGSIKGANESEEESSRSKRREGLYEKRRAKRRERRDARLQYNAQNVSTRFKSFFGRFFGSGTAATADADFMDADYVQVADNQYVDANGRVRGRANTANAPSVIQLGPGHQTEATNTGKPAPSNDEEKKDERTKARTDSDRIDSDETDESANRKRRRIGRFKSNNEYLGDIAKYNKKIYNEIHGQLGGTGWNIAYIKTLLENQYGPLSDDQLPEEMEGSKKVKKKRGFFGRMKDRAGDMIGNFTDTVKNFFGFGRDKDDDGKGGGGKGRGFGMLIKLIFSPFKILNKIMEVLGDTASLLVDGLVGAAKMIGKGVTDVVSALGGLIKSAAPGIGKALGSAAEFVAGSMKDIGLAFTATARGLVEFVADSIPEVGHLAIKGMKAIGKGVFKGAKFVGNAIGSGAKWAFDKITGKKKTDDIRENVKNIGSFRISGGYLDNVNETVIRIGDPMNPIPMPVVTLFNGKPTGAITTAIPVYVAGGQVSTDDVDISDRAYKNAYLKADRAAERARDPNQSYDRSIALADSREEMEAVLMAKQLNGSSSPVLALPGTVSNTENTENNSFINELLGASGTGGLLSGLLGGSGGGLGGKVAAAIGGTALGSKILGAVGKGKGLLGTVGSFLKTAGKGALPLALGTAIGTATGTEDRVLTGGLKMAALPFYNLLTNGTATGKHGMVGTTFNWIKEKLGFGPAPSGLTTGLTGPLSWNERIRNTLNNIGNKILGKTDDIAGIASDAATSSGAAGLLTKAKSLVGEIISTGKDKLGALGSSAMSKLKGLGSAVSTTKVGAKAAELINKIIDVAKNATNNSVVSAILDKLPNARRAITSTLSKMKTKLGSVLANVSAETLEQIGKKLGVVVTIATTVYDIASGYNEAANILKIDSSNLTTGMRITAALAKGLSGLAFGLIPVSWFTEVIYDFFASDDKEQDLENYQTAFKTAAATAGMSVDAYNAQQNKTTWQSIKDGAAKVKDTVSSWMPWNWGQGPAKNYSQRSAMWNHGSNSIALTGCGPTAAAIVASAYGKSGTPSEANQMSHMMGMRAPDGGTNPAFFKQYAAGKGYGMDQGPTSSGMIESNLNKGRPVVLMGKGGDFGNNVHYLVADRSLGKGRVNIIDPLTGSNKSSSLGSLVQNTTSTIYSYGKGPGSNTASAQNALVRALSNIQGKLAYSLDWDKQDPDKGVASCASTVGWAYKKVLGGDFTSNPMSASSTTQAQDSRFKTIWVNDGSTPLDMSKLQPGDVLYMNWDRNSNNDKMQHTEMYSGNNQNLSHGGNPHYGPVYKDFNAYRKKHLMKVRRYIPFIDNKTVTYDDSDFTVGAFTGTSEDTTATGGNLMLDKVSSLLGGIANKYDNFIGRLFGRNDESVNEDGTTEREDSTGITSSTKSSMIKGTTTGEKIWNFLIGKGLSKTQAAGIMGNLHAESGLIPNNLQNSYNRSLGMTDAEYTTRVNNKTYTNFNNDAAGYGLAQWTSAGRKEGLYNSAVQSGKPIDDLGLQLDYLWSELNGSYKNSVLNPIKSSNTVRDASTIFLQKYEVPKGYKEASTINTRAGYAQSMYDTYGKGPGWPTIPQVSSWGMGGSTGDTTNLSAMNDKIRRINRSITKARAEAAQAETATQVTAAITDAVNRATTSDSSTDQVLKVLTASLSTMIQLLSDIKDNTAHKDTEDADTSKPNNYATVRADHFSADSGVGTNSTDIGAKIIDNLTSK